MLLGILLGISVTVFFTSLMLILAEIFGSSQSFLTGAVIGGREVFSFSVLFLVLSTVAIFFLIGLLRPRRRF